MQAPSRAAARPSRCRPRWSPSPRSVRDTRPGFLGPNPGHPLRKLHQRLVCRAHAAADVEELDRPAARGRGRAETRVRDVANEHEVARDAGPGELQLPAGAERCHHSGHKAGRCLPRPVDGEQAQDDGANAGFRSQLGAEQRGRRLRGAAERRGTEQGIVGDRPVRLPVLEGTAEADQPRDAGRGHSLAEVEGAQDRVRDRRPPFRRGPRMMDAGCGRVEHHVRPDCGDDVGDVRRVCEIDLVDGGSRAHRLEPPAAGGRADQRVHFHARLLERLHEVGADEPGGTGDQGPVKWRRAAHATTERGAGAVAVAAHRTASSNA